MWLAKLMRPCVSLHVSKKTRQLAEGNGAEKTEEKEFHFGSRHIQLTPQLRRGNGDSFRHNNAAILDRECARPPSPPRRHSPTAAAARALPFKPNLPLRQLHPVFEHGLPVLDHFLRFEAHLGAYK